MIGHLSGRALRLAGAAVVMVAATGFVACGGGDDDDAAKPTTAATKVATAAATADNGDEPGGVLTLVSKNTLFDKTKLRAKEGEITINHDNQDGGIVHNVAVFKGKDATGERMGATELEAGPGKQTLTLTLEEGEYFFVCEAHPATMAGQLIVE